MRMQNLNFVAAKRPRQPDGAADIQNAINHYRSYLHIFRNFIPEFLLQLFWAREMKTENTAVQAAQKFENVFFDAGANRRIGKKHQRNGLRAHTRARSAASH